MCMYIVHIHTKTSGRCESSNFSTTLFARLFLLVQNKTIYYFTIQYEGKGVKLVLCLSSYFLVLQDRDEVARTKHAKVLKLDFFCFVKP